MYHVLPHVASALVIQLSRESFSWSTRNPFWIQNPSTHHHHNDAIPLLECCMQGPEPWFSKFTWHWPCLGIKGQGMLLWCTSDVDKFYRKKVMRCIKPPHPIPHTHYHTMVAISPTEAAAIAPMAITIAESFLNWIWIWMSMWTLTQVLLVELLAAVRKFLTLRSQVFESTAERRLTAVKHDLLGLFEHEKLLPSTEQVRSFCPEKLLPC